MDNEPVPGFCRSDALRLTFNPVELTKTVGRADPFHNATEFDSNPVPEIVMVAAIPGGTPFGVTISIVGVGLFTLKLADAEVPPPGAGFWTVNKPCKLPVKSAAASVTFTSVPLTNVVARDVPFHMITDDRSNPVPLTSTTVSPAPATMLVGLSLLIVGVGLFTGKSIPGDVPPPGDGLTTVNFATLPSDRLAAGNMALKVVDDTKVVTTGAPFH
jgi:hypothetical protein